MKSYIISVLIALATGGFSALATMGNMGIYSRLETPPFAPPAILFPIVWTILYILMGISAAIIYNNRTSSLPERKSALYTYGLSLFFNFLWSIFFFNQGWLLFSFFWLLGLLFLIIRTIMKYYKISPLAAYLQIPYLLWVGFAGVLNFSIWWLNRM